MKFTKPIIIIVAMVAIIAITYSCSKQDNTEPVSSTPEISKSEADILIENKIKAFKSKMELLRENPSYKSSETMSADSAVWYMEAASNQTYADGASEFSKSVSDTFSIVIDATNGEVLLNDVVDAYDDMIESLSTAYHALPGESNHLVVNDISLTTTDESTVTLGVNAVFGSSIDGIDAMFNYPWYYGELLGRCDGSGLGVGSDAAEQIEDVIIRRKGTEPSGTYYTSIQSVEILGDCCENPNDPYPGDNYNDYLMFFNYSGWQNYHECVSVDELNFYLLGTEEVIYNLQRPAGKDLITIDLDGLILVDGDTIEHFATVEYGIKHAGGGAIEL